MRKISFLSVVFLSLLFSRSHSQLSISKITKNYFRSDPFEGEFSAFMIHLINDPTLVGKIVEKKTDTSLFYFQGTYQSFNPFFFKPKRVQVVLTELPVDVDSLERDTIYSYQLFAYDDDTKEGVQELKKEFEKIFRRYKGIFPSNQYSPNPAGEGTSGETYNFFDPYHVVAPFALSWFGPTKKNEICLVLTIRLATRANLAVLPVPFYAPK